MYWLIPEYGYEYTLAENFKLVTETDMAGGVSHVVFDTLGWYSNLKILLSISVKRGIYRTK